MKIKEQMSRLWPQTSSLSAIPPGFIGDIDISKIRQAKNSRRITLNQGWKQAINPYQNS